MLKKPLSKLSVPILGLICLSTQAADEPYGLCKDGPVPKASQQSTALDPNTPAQFTADRAKRDESGIATLEGTVHMTRGTQTADADSLRYDENNKIAYASGNVRAEDGQLVIESQEAELHLDTDYAKSTDATYQYKPLHARGSADSVERTSADFVRLENTTYTTCEEGDRSWELSADEIELDKASGDGIGKDVLVKFKGVPIFYTPWIRFPIDDRRKTGFLTPIVGNSRDSGFQLVTPWYWNIAPNRDAIFAPRELTDRGLQLQTSFRYLNKKSFGQLRAEYLDDHEFDDDRYLISIDDTHYFTPKIELDIFYNKVSDDNYFEDLGNDIGLASTQNLERRGDLHYRGEHWQFLTRAQSFQEVDPSVPNTDKPYERLPQIKLDGDYFNIPGGFNFISVSEWVNFENDNKTTVDGDRLNLGIELELPFESSGYFIRPGARFTHTQYDLNRTDGLDDNPTRSLPSANIDAGLIFERAFNKTGYTQTLEPRLYYLYTPFRNQSDIPSFDTAEYDFRFEQLWRDNRFSGTDRIGDANQLSVGLTTRVLDLESGEEKLRASLGRIYYFSDRKVVLPDQLIETEDSSEVAAELKIGLSDRWEAIGSALWDTHDDQTLRNSLTFQYRSENNFILNMSYQYRNKVVQPVDPATNQRSNLEQSDVSMVLPINDNWRTIARWNYDLEEKRNLDLLGGVEYDTCCWKIRLAARRYNRNTDEDYNNSIELQLVLKGLGQIGSQLGKLLERGIRGYDDRDDEYLY